MPNNLIEVLIVAVISVIMVALITVAASGLMKSTYEVIDQVQNRSDEVIEMLQNG